jgi:hypothetical protein
VSVFRCFMSNPNFRVYWPSVVCDHTRSDVNCALGNTSYNHNS